MHTKCDKRLSCVCLILCRIRADQHHVLNVKSDSHTDTTQNITQKGTPKGLTLLTL